MKKNNIRKTSFGLTAAALALAMSMSAFAATDTAASDAGRTAPPSFGIEAGREQGQRPESQPPMGGQMGQMGQMGQKPEDGKGPMADIREKVDTLDSSAAKTRINTLMEELETAMEAERKLMDANRPEKPEGETGTADTSAEKKELPELKNGEKPELPAMKDGEKPALPAMKDGEKPEMPEESAEMKAAREKVEAARTALETALKDAGIEADFSAGQPGAGQPRDGKAPMEKPDFQPDQKPDQKPDAAPEIPAGEAQTTAS